MIIYIIIQTTVKVLSDKSSAENINKLSEYTTMVKVVRFINKNRTTLEIDSRELVIGDLILLESNTIMTSDVMLIEGHCLVNEAILTGESMPVTKTESV